MQNSILEWHLDVGLSIHQMREEGWLTSLFPEDPDHPSLFSMPGPSRDAMTEEEEWKPRDPSMMRHSFSHLECQGAKERKGSIGVLVNTGWATSLLCYRPDKLRPSERKVIDIGTHRVLHLGQSSGISYPQRTFFEVKILTSELWSGPGFPNLWDLTPDGPRWRWCNNNRREVHSECNVLESSWNHRHSPPHPWKTVFHETSPWRQKGWWPLT